MHWGCFVEMLGTIFEFNLFFLKNVTKTFQLVVQFSVERCQEHWERTLQDGGVVQQVGPRLKLIQLMELTQGKGEPHGSPCLYRGRAGQPGGQGGGCGSEASQAGLRGGEKSNAGEDGEWDIWTSNSSQVISF